MIPDSKPSIIKIVISRDKLMASIYVQIDSPSLDKEMVYKELEKSGVRYGMKHLDIAAFCLSPSRQPVIIAEGIPAQQGKDGYMKVLYPSKQKGKVNPDDETVDFRETSDLVSVEENTQLVEVYPPEPGFEGIAVTGEQIDPPRAKYIKLQAGKGVYLSEDQNKAYSRAGGRPWIRVAGIKRIVSCDPLYVHNGNVDIKEGNLRFNGDARITGSVDEAMEVQVTGNLEIQGLVTMAKVSSGGRMIINNNAISSKLRAGVLFPGAKKVTFMISDIHTELQNLDKAVELLKERGIINLQNFDKALLGMLDMRFKNIRPLIRKLQEYTTEKSGDLPPEISEAVNSLSCFLGINPISEKMFFETLEIVTSVLDMLERGGSLANCGISIRAAFSSIIQSSGDVEVTGQGCVNTNITAGGSVKVKGSFKGGDILCDGNVEVNELGSNLGTPPVVRVSAGSTIDIKKVYSGATIQVGRRRVTLTKSMEHLRAKLNKEDELELF